MLAVCTLCVLLSSGLVNVHRLEYISPQLLPQRNLAILPKQVPTIEQGVFACSTYVKVR